MRETDEDMFEEKPEERHDRFVRRVNVDELAITKM